MPEAAPTATYELFSSNRSVIFRLPEMHELEYANTGQPASEATTRLLRSLEAVPEVEKVMFVTTTQPSINIILYVTADGYSDETRLAAQAVIQDQIPGLTFVHLLAFTG